MSKIDDKNNENLDDKNLNKKVEGYHINNMVGVNLTSNRLPTSDSKALEGIKNIEKISRILLDLFAVSINPKTVKNGWKIDKSKTEKWDWKPRGKLDNLLPDDFFKHFIKSFSEIIELDNEYLDIGGGEGYNAGRKYTIKDTNGTIQFRYFDPSQADPTVTYASGSPENNYFRQKINMKITGDGLQELRQRGVLVQFLKGLYEQYECEVTMFDIACDMFNYGLIPLEFADLYRDYKYIGRSKVEAMGDVFNPTVYIGKYKRPRTIMLYDKLQEAKDKSKSDEPELVEALKETDGSWFRLEQHFSRDQNEASQGFNYLMSDVLNATNEQLDDVFNRKLSMFLKQHVSAKCRFLSRRRTEKNTERIKTHKKWQLILDILGDTMSDFAFERPVLTLYERMMNFKYRSLGGKQLFIDIVDERGELALDEFLIDVSEYVKNEYRERERNGKAD